MERHRAKKSRGQRERMRKGKRRIAERGIREHRDQGMGREEKERQIVETEMKGKEAEDNNKKIGIII